MRLGALSKLRNFCIAAVCGHIRIGYGEVGMLNALPSTPAIISRTSVIEIEKRSLVSLYCFLALPRPDSRYRFTTSSLYVFDC